MRIKVRIHYTQARSTLNSPFSQFSGNAEKYSNQVDIRGASSTSYYSQTNLPFITIIVQDSKN